MTYFPVQSPYNLFSDIDGEPLESGYIYIGEANQNPITNPITVYWDMDGLYPVAQPIRTINGYLDRNGSPSNIFVNTTVNNTYSIIVKDKRLNTIYYSKDVASEETGNLFYSEITNVKQYGAKGDGVTDDTDAVNAALQASAKIRFPAGTYNLDGVVIPADNKTIIGDGQQNTILNITTTAPSYGISLGNHDSTTFIDIKIQGSDGTKYCITDGGTAYYTRFTRVSFFRAEVMLTITADFYWSTFTDCYFRDCDRGVLAAVGNDFNAVTFTGCTFWHSSPATSNDCIDVTGGDGITFQGCQVQNQGVRLDGCTAVRIEGGYWEAYTRAAIVAVNSTSIFMDGIYAPSATRFEFDESSAALLSGTVPDHIVSKDATSVQIINYGGANSLSISPIINIFPDISCSTTDAADALTYSPTGLLMTKSINGSSNLELTWTANNRHAGFSISGNTGISVYVYWRVTAGTGKVQLYSTNQTHISQVDSTIDADWRYYRASSEGASAARLLFSPVTTTGTIEVDTIVVSPCRSYIKGVEDIVNRLYLDSLTTPLLTADTVAAIDLTADTINLGGAIKLLDRKVGSIVSVPGGGSATGYTFTTADYGFWYVVVDRGGFAATNLHFWQGFVMVGSNSLIRISVVDNLYFSLTSSGLVLTINNSAGTADGRVTAFKLGDA